MIVSNYPAKRRKNDVIPFLSTANGRIPESGERNGKSPKIPALEARKTAEKRHTRKKNQEWRN